MSDTGDEGVAVVRKRSPMLKKPKKKCVKTVPVETVPEIKKEIEIETIPETAPETE